MREMKDSGIEWIKEMPTNWDLKKLKYLTTKCERGTAPDYIDDNITAVVNQATFSKGFFDTSNIRFSSKPAETSRGLLKKHDILLASTGGGVLGKTFYFNEAETYVADGHVTIIRTNSALISKFLYYYFYINFETFNSQMAEGSTNQTELQRDLLCEMPVPLPPLPEQRIIASFLDAKCAEIDALTADIQQQIDALEQYKRSVITEAVTKGLNPEAKMKDSGIGWMPCVPKHWKVDKLKYHLKYCGDRNPGEKEVLSLYRELGVVPKDSRDDNHNVTSEDTTNYRFVRIGDFVVNKMKAWQGSVAVSDYEGIVSPAYFVYRFTDDIFDRKYFHYLLRNKTYTTEFMRLSGGIRVGQWDLPASALDNILVLIPPMDEQKAIADYLDAKCAEIDGIISQKREQISTIEEYKKSLIFEYVTGKKEVPNNE